MSAGVGSFLISRQILLAALHPLLQVHILILQRVGEFVGHDRLLLFHRHPVEQVHGFRLGIVVAGYLFAEQGDEEGFQIEVVRKQAELLQHEFGAAQALRVFVVQVLGEIGDDLVAAGQFALHLTLDGQPGLFAVEGENLVDGVEEFFGLTGSNFDFALGFFGRRNRLGRLLLLGRSCAGWSEGGLFWAIDRSRKRERRQHNRQKPPSNP